LPFKAVHLFEDQILGIGSYGKVCKAECDGLFCAAKIIHKTLCDPTAQEPIAPHREHRLPMRRFEQDCEFLRTISHPNIIQYLGMYQYPKVHLPVLLMELMDTSLKKFLESSPKPIPYHIQINVCHDITLALSFLHSNGIIHRDLSSNNVLMNDDTRAKVTDFGMASLGEKATHLTFTICPGTDVYMPPEAVQDKRVYTEKIDCFSFGVNAIQIMTRLFPQPGNRRKQINIENVGLVEKRVSEHERRRNHISEIDPSHPLLAIALDCLKDEDVNRPSAEELCKRVASLKYSDKYKVLEQGRDIARYCRGMEFLQQQHAIKISELQETIQSQTALLEKKNQEIVQKEEAVAAGLQRNSQLRKQHEEEMKDRENKKRNEVLNLTTELEHENRDKEMALIRITELELKTSQAQLQQSMAKSREAQGKVNMTLKWRKGKKAPCKMSNRFVGMMAAAVDGNSVYVMEWAKVYAYDASTNSWSQLPDSRFKCCALAIINNSLTVIGGRKDMITTNKLFSLTRNGGAAEWSKEYPPMPTSRYGACALCTGAALIVAGGQGNADAGKLATIEVLNTATRQWSTAVDLPQQMFGGSLLQIGNDTLYMLGAYGRYPCPIPSMYSCSFSAFLQSCIPQSLGSNSTRSPSLEVWRRGCGLPATDSAYISLHGRLLAVGGKDSVDRPVKTVHLYNPSSNSWEMESQVATPRCECYAAVLPNNQLVVVGGYTGKDKTETVEIGTPFL
jgi:serine/threonine protein kinase